MQRFSFAVVFILALLCGVALATPTKLHFKKGQQFSYSLKSRVDSIGYTKSHKSTPGTYSHMNSQVLTKVTDINKDGDYLFVMNMFGTKVGVGQTATETEEETPADVHEVTEAEHPLGYDMYFLQKPTGEISKIWYNKDDKPYFVQVKVSAINAFQTKVVGVGSHHKAQEDDPVGVHYSNFAGSSGSHDAPLTVAKTFNQKDVTKFADPKVSPHNVNLDARTTTGIHKEGYINSASVDQTTILISANTDKSTNQESSVEGSNDLTGFNMDMRAKGSLNIQLEKTYSAQESQVELGTLSLESIQSDNNMLSSSQSIVANDIIVNTIQNDANLEDPKASIGELLEIEDDKKVSVLLRELTTAIKANPDLVKTIQTYLHQTEVLNDKVARDRLFFLLSVSGNTEAQDILNRYGIQSQNIETSIHALLSAGNAFNPTHSLIQAVWSSFENKQNDDEVRDTALFAFSNNIRNADDVIAKKGVSRLQNILTEAIYNTEENDGAVSILNALANIGSKAVDVQSLPEAVYSHSEFRVRVAAINFLEQYSESTFAMEKLHEMATQDKSIEIRHAASQVLKTTFKGQLDSPDYSVVAGSYFPYNKSFDKDFKLGGDVINAKFDAELFAGTNFDCNHKYFNYEGLAKASGDAHVFGVDQSLFEAKAIYGKRHGSVVGNELLLTIFDKTVYQKKIPTLNCQEHNYKLFHTAPGFSVKYTVWVSVVPITFKASADLKITADWGWKICDDKLSAMVELIPTGTLTVSGDAEINLLIIRGGVELAAAFNTALIPQAYIHGSECTLGFDVQRKSTPMSAYFEGYFATKKCKFIFFDCHWGKHHQKKFWKWSEPSHDETIYRKEWKIASA
eukprot:gb/GECH01004494.1/.p1 GENE.gb/GECH01004494.1/~~gb/GECH01004494.1/.p1  ORF type:complete len:853 (+),score=228.62 gb/GECH01004494.1/:1-2559(+)